MIKALDQLEVITLFAEDLPATRDFYRGVFGLETVFADENGAVLRFGTILINLLAVSEAPDLMAPAKVASADAGARALLTIKVENVDAVVAELTAHGVHLINGPMDRPWGRRTASFADPAGNVWEVAQNLPRAADQS
jgi:catechol 2,3-dioxygenase-like lactoylglutathione lyase family enzyme